jgi:8-oxo-dGTP diphosphatase
MKSFNLRVYGLAINDRNELLVSDEFICEREITKFPGGGLLWGEGTEACLKREFREELKCETEIIKHFYTTDFFQLSAFNPDHQIISMYYFIRFLYPEELTKNNLFKSLRDEAHPFKTKDQKAFQSLRWIPISSLHENDFTFPIDKKVTMLLKEDYSKSL